MFKVQLKLVISITVLLSDFLTVYSQSATGATTENVVVTIKNYFKPEEIAAALNRDNQSEPANDSAKLNARAGFSRTARAKTTTSTMELFRCAISLDVSCLMDHVENIVDNANNNLLRQADAEARRISAGRSDSDSEEESSPSSLIASIAEMLLELPELLKDSLGGMLRSGKVGVGDITGDNASESEKEEEEEDGEEEGEEEDDDEAADEDEEEEEDDDDDESDDNKNRGVESKGDENVDENGRKKCGKKKDCDIGGGGGGDGYGTTDSEVGDGRGKKKKKKKAIIKLLLLGLLIKAKVTLLLKLLAGALQIKFLLIALANLLLNLARFWWDLKKGGHEQPQKVIYYEHAQHQHHYDGAEDWHSSSPGGGGYWGRAYEEEQGDRTAQDMAYSKQVPKGTTYSRVDDKPNISWNPWG